MNWIAIVAAILAHGTIVALYANMSYAANAVGTADEWITTQSILYNYVVGGLIGTVVLMSTAFLMAMSMGANMSWILTLILSIFAFSTAFGAMAMGAVSQS